MKIKNFLFVAAFFLLLAVPADAAVPKLLAYQGVLKNGSGSFLTGTYSMTFRIYPASTGGSAFWTETHSSVSASSGKFSVQLGSVTALNLDFNSDYWLSIQVGIDAEMSPRIRLTSMGYSVRSDYENNGFTQGAHDALSHKSIEGVKDNTVNIAKTNFKLDAYSLASANSMGDLVVDTFTDSTGIHAGASSGHTWRGTPNYDVVLNPGGLDANAVLALHANGADGSASFTDSSSGAKTVTANGNAQIDTAQSKFGGASLQLDGTTDYLSSADHADWDIGTGDFTWDFWIRFDEVGVDSQVLFDRGDATPYCLFHNSAGNFALQFNGAVVKTEAGGISINTWYHLAVVRSGTNLMIFKDGAQLGSPTTNSSDLSGTAGIAIGAQEPTGNAGFKGHIDEFRFSKGVARWTANFTPPSAEYASASGSATVISNAYSEPAAPTEAMVIPDETLGTGSITYYVSRDNGATWTQLTKETVTNISSQPSGTQLKWKAVITGNAELNAIAVAV